MDKKDKSESKFKSFLSSKYNKAAIIVLEVSVLLTVVVVTCLVLTGKVSFGSSDETKYVLPDTTVSGNIQYKTPPTFAESEKSVLTIPDVSQEAGNGGVTLNSDGYTQSSNGVGSYSSIGGSSSSAGASSSLADPSGWSKSQILAKAKDAVNKTKSYTGKLTVQHSENFDADVTQCTGGSVVASIANVMVGWVVSPVDETLNYNGGKAVNSDGETIPILLPKRGNFTLNESGLSSCSARKSGNEYIIKLGIVKESVGLYDIPKNNAASVGYLDVASLDLSFMEIDSADIVYKGSTLELHINSAGYVTYAEYVIPMNIKGSAHKGSLSGSATFDGVQTEKWTLKW